MNYRIYIFFAFLSTAILVACSTEKNTFLNRTYHSTTAHYNGYFNANDLINQAMLTYQTSLKEDFDELLPVFPLPNETEVLGLYPAIDTAIVKCTKVITNHSMPSAENPSSKKEEHNRWIDENWTTIGKANFYRRDYEDALKSLEYVRKFYGKDPSNYIASLWIAKTQIEQKDYSKATLTLEKLSKAAKEFDEKVASNKKFNFKKKETTEAGKKKKKPSRKAKKRAKKKAKKEEEENKTVDFPKSIRFDLEKTQADLAIKKGLTDEAIEFLESSLKFAKKKQEKARVHFILGQLYANKGSNQEAKDNFTKVIKYSSRFEMTFNARIQRAFMGGDAKIKKEFEKMLRDAKNAEYKDQIYFALAEIAFQEGNKEKGIEYLHKSALYSINNPKQKGRSYEKLGDLSYADRDYVRAQKYYDSCAKVIPENYKNGEVVKNKADKLKSLVEAVNIANYEDSVQRIAAMSPAEQEVFAEKLIKKIKEDEEQRKRMEASRKAEIQSQQALFNQNTSGNKWYWNNARTRSDGFDEFRKNWGSRENEDNWRRSDKIVAANQVDLVEDEVVDGSSNASASSKDELSVEKLLKDIPQGDSAIAASNQRLVNALYDAGIIYKDQLNEKEIAAKQFEAILARNYESDFNLLASFQLYKLNESANSAKAEVQKDYILTYYPNSDYANYLRDPNFFVKRKEIEKLAEGEYVRVLDRYNRGLYYPVLTKANQVIEEEKENPYRPKFMLLKALSLGQLNTDKSDLVPVLEQLSLEYPNTPEDSVGKEMLAIIKNGYSKDIETNYNKKSIYKYEEKKEHWVIIFLDEKQSSNIAKTQISDFNKEFFGKEKLNTSSKIFGDNQSVITVKVMTEMEAVRYMRIFKETKKYLLDLNKCKIISISQENMKVLFETKKLAEYELFYLEKY